MSGHRTPWSKSSLPSDRLKPKVKGPSNTPKSKSKGSTPEPPPEAKSKDVRKLEKFLKAIKDGGKEQEKDPKGGCFCLAETHPLSNYTPICHSCGLILCALNLPCYSCPSCGQPLIVTASPTAFVRSSSWISYTELVQQIEYELLATIAKEQEEKERAIEDARQAAGAFPTLAGPSLAAPSPNQSRPASGYLIPAQQTHKVLSLTGGASGRGGKKRVVLTTYTTKVPAPAQSTHSGSDEIYDDVIAEFGPRIPRPTPRSASIRAGTMRPYQNTTLPGLGADVTYLPPLRLDEESAHDEGGEKTKSSRRRRGKGKEKEKEIQGGAER